MLDLRFQPMTERAKRAEGRHGYAKSPFKDEGTAMLDDLERELAFLKAKDVVIESGHRREDIRNDGWPKSGSSAVFPDVRLFFTCKHGTLRYECAAFEKWRANLRAIGLWMQRQRLALEEWGIGSGGEAYRGFAALPAGTGMAMPEWTSVEAAIRWMAFMCVLPSDTHPAKLYRECAKLMHPDVTRDNGAAMAKLNRAREFIDKVTTYLTDQTRIGRNGRGSHG